MAFHFQKTSCSCLAKVLERVQNMEQTHEIRIPSGMPGIARVVSAWGQPVMRSKEWHGSSISLSAGMLVWVLYISEEGDKPQCVNAWIPFQIHWDLPELCPDGKVRILCIPRYVDARSVSAGKILVRAGVAALAEAWCGQEKEIYCPQDVPEGVELLQSVYPLRLPKEAGEKQFVLEEELSLPASAPVPKKLVYYRLEPSVYDQKVMANKVVFRGNGNLHVLYESGEGQLHTWDFELPWSQFADLEASYSQEAQADVRLMPTNVELDTDETGKFHLKCSLVAQYLVDDREMVELTEDAYSPGRELTLQQEQLELPSVLDNRRELLTVEQTIPGDSDLVVDTVLLPDFPQQYRTEDAVRLTMPGMLQLLYYGVDGSVQSATSRWEGTLTIPADESGKMMALPQMASEVHAHAGADAITVQGEVPVHLQFSGGTGLPMVTGIELGEVVPPDPGRPSLVIRRAEGTSLWHIAKKSGSTVDSIRRANGLTGDALPGQMLLIPVK